MTEQNITRPDKCYVIAEAGVNHNGSLDTAISLVDAAKNAGADAIKFQTFDAGALVSRDADKPCYQHGRTPEETQFELLSNLELGREDFVQLRDYCHDIGIEFLSTPYGPSSVVLLADLGVKSLKIASADLVNKPLLRAASNTDAALLVSTGMASIKEITRSLHWLNEFGVTDLTLLHCISCYPTDYDDVNMRFMQTLQEVFDVPVGFSDHTHGIEIPIMAVSMGATVVEKHFTLDRSMKGPDHEISLEPDQLGQMISSIRNVESAKGRSVKIVPDCERENAKIMRQSIHTSESLSSGDHLATEHISIHRPNDGIESAKVKEIIGRKLVHDLAPGDPITWKDLA